MKMIRRSLCALAVGLAPAAHADFSWEIAGFGSQSERTDHFDPDVVNTQTDATSVSGTYYVEAVADGSGPSALAAFLDPTTNVFVAVGNDEITTEFNAEASELETRTYTLGGIYLLPRSKWYVGGSYTRADSDETPPPPPPVVVSADYDDTRYRVVTGKYFGSGATRLEGSFERRTIETEYFSDPCLRLCSASVDNTFDVEKLDVRHVRRFRSATYVIFGGISRTDSQISGTLTELFTPGGPPFTQTFDDEVYAFDAYSIGAEIYPIASVGVRLGYTRVEGETTPDDHTVDVGVSWFLRRNIGLELTFSREHPEEFDSTERVALRVSGRL